MSFGLLHLLRVNTTRIVVLEPPLGSVSLAPRGHDPDWVIVGSETGQGSPRPMDLDWVRRVRDEALEAGVPFFVKQLNNKHGDQAERELDGRVWGEFPQGFVK